MDLETSKGKACEQTIYNNRLSIGQNGSVMGTCKNASNARLAIMFRNQQVQPYFGHETS